MGLELLCNHQRFFAELSFHHAAVGTAGARPLARCLPGRVLAGQHAARHRAVGHHAQPVVLACRQDLHLRHPVQQVVVGLARHRTRHAQLAAQACDFRNAPAAEVRHRPVADLAAAHQVAHCPHRLFQVRAGIVAVQVENVDVVRRQPVQAVLHRAQDPGPRIVPVVGRRLHRVAQLGGKHPVVAVGGQQAPDHLLRRALGVYVGGVDEVHAVVARAGDDAGGFDLIGLVAEHHGAQAKCRNAQVAGAEAAVGHGCGRHGGSFGWGGMASGW
ncbi:hypothetical protein D9M72_150900 [compost metagenome]